ncbi:ABC transporter substrate-binding protein [Mesorhizobium sp. CO1-1-8]|uniref:ABC transporter substrate-binding protein n=1 Tax=Mesorhizobium sp. CO1-1-8 TaxID=2876631 RepID=UPI001CD0B2B8|nr:ABC transporter substrate-binding protein [Mesorhizobium sp. CO1-1-8]MBZ9772415.1 ABC transporter substrate-binding protein [Mesorhizobium sp. CO1-1-8]
MRIGTTAAAALAAVSLLATSASGQETIKIGVNEPVTGIFASAGQYIVNGAKIAADEINGKGGVLGKQIELVIEDNKSTPTDAADAAEKLMVRDKVPVMMGAYTSTQTLAVLPKLMEYSVPLLVETASSSKVTTQGNPWVFRISPTLAVEAEGFTKEAVKRKIKKVNFLLTTNDFGIDGAKQFREQLSRAGIEIGAEERMDAAAQDLSAQLSTIKASDADALVVFSYAEQIALVLRQAYTIGLKQTIIAPGGSTQPDLLIELAGSAAEGSYYDAFLNPWTPDATQNPDVIKALITEWKKRDLKFAGLGEGFRGYDGIQAIAEAIRLAGKAEPEAIRDAFWKIKAHGAGSDIQFVKDGPAGSESGQNHPQVYFVQIKDGKVISAD